MAIAEGWLEQYLDQAIERRLCTMIGCTTCGAQDFRAGLNAGLARPGDDLRRLNADRSLPLLESASKLVAPQARHSERVEAIRLVLFDCWVALGGDNALPQMKERLGRGWAGQVLNEMIAHHEVRTRVRREHEVRSDPAAARQRRQQLKGERQQRHQERLEKKRQRDAKRRSGEVLDELK